MSTIKIVRKHNLGDKQIHEKIQALAEQFSHELGLQYQWRNNRVNISRSGAKGYIEMRPGELELELQLGLLLRPLKGKIEQVIGDYLDEHLGS